jgi:16S rRNA G1207 methylase RsmC
VGKAAVETVIREARRRLRPGGSLWLVVPTKKGAKGYLSLMEELFAKAETADISGGFRVLKGTRG